MRGRGVFASLLVEKGADCEATEQARSVVTSLAAHFLFPALANSAQPGTEPSWLRRGDKDREAHSLTPAPYDSAVSQPMRRFAVALSLAALLRRPAGGTALVALSARAPQSVAARQATCHATQLTLQG